MSIEHSNSFVCHGVENKVAPSKLSDDLLSQDTIKLGVANGIERTFFWRLLNGCNCPKVPKVS